MQRITLRNMLLLLLLPAVCCVLSACRSSDEAADVQCVIGVTSDGSAYTAAVQLEDSDWDALSKAQKENVVGQCVDTVELSREDDDTAYELTGVDKATKEQLFIYSGSDQKITFTEERK